MTNSERVELNELRKEMDLRSLGDRPSSPSAEKLGRLIDLIELERAERVVKTSSPKAQRVEE